MRSINQIFKSHPELKEKPQVAELIDYCRELEDANVELTQSQKTPIDKMLKQMCHEIYKAIVAELKEDEEAERFGEIERVDFKQALVNLKRHMDKFSSDYGYWFERS